MKNIIVYTSKKVSALADVLAKIDETNVRIEDAEKLKEYETLNPSLVVVEDVPNLKDVLMTTKFKVPVLFIGEPFKGTVVRSVAFDLIKTPVDNTELIIRVKSLLKIQELRLKLETVSTTDELTGSISKNVLNKKFLVQNVTAQNFRVCCSILTFSKS